jgi:hypothetical protein
LQALGASRIRTADLLGAIAEVVGNERDRRASLSQESTGYGLAIPRPSEALLTTDPPRICVWRFSASRSGAELICDAAPRSGGPFLGDYVGLSHAGATFIPFYTQTASSSNPTDIFASFVP